VFTLFPVYLNTISTFIVHLNVEHNRLTHFNVAMEGVTFTHLKTLKLSNNRLKSIESGGPTSFPMLEELFMNYNGLTSLPDDFAQMLPRLRVLSLSSNKLEQITEHQFSKTLEILDLSNNDIGALPSGLSTLEHLKELVVFGNR
jgi:Leucine-rich repeat (LRR) protein